MKLKLTKGSSARGAQMGRPNHLPLDTTAKIKMHLQRLSFIDGCYDAGGAYWGLPANVYLARSVVDVSLDIGESGQAEMYIRANSRNEARAKVLKTLPSATFFR